MHSFVLLTLAPLALANHLFMRSLLPRQQGNAAFQPSSTFDFDCKYPCGEDWCLEPSDGDVCCTEGYACPGGSFCLTQGYCCPDGVDPKTCAIQNGVTLAAGFKASQTVAVAASTGTVAATSPIPASVTPATTAATIAPSPKPFTSATLPSPSTTTETTPPSSSVAQFTGGAMRFAVDGGVAAMVFGAVGLLV